MAKIASFRGYRFNPSTVGDLAKVVTQPYDKIDDALRDDYMQRSDHNIIRITKNPPRPDDTFADNVYTRAGQVWEQWIEERVLIREGGPALYPYHQEFTVEGQTYVRKGLIALVDIDDEKSAVRAHEQTLSGPKADRLKLMRATEANDDLIFMLYDDPQRQILEWLEPETAWASPVAQVTDDFGAVHKLYRVTRPSLIADINDFLAGKELFIADGHHRYETAMNYLKEAKSRNWKPMGAESFDHRIMALFNLHDPGLVVLPTHRALHSLAGYDGGSFMTKAATQFAISEYSSREALYAAMDEAAAGGRVVIGFGSEGLAGYRLLTLKDPATMDALVADHSTAWKRLDVTVLHVALLEKLLGIDAAALAAESNIHYIRGRDEALDAIGQHGIQCAFLLNPTRVEQVGEIASAGERMPQKSTDFYPKLLTGLVMMKMTIDKSAGLAVWEAEG
ncbi:MAG: DUF1015 domain-containing protein [Calditrichaeota bacterium]|nr:DUF1015 domain-containing protein [Calditrichota bacterium]